MGGDIQLQYDCRWHWGGAVVTMMDTPGRIYVDAGNTAVKFYRCRHHTWTLLWRQATAEQPSLPQCLARLQATTHCAQLQLVVCSVVPSWSSYLRQLARTYAQVQLVWLNPAQPPRGLQFNSQLQPSKIGADLLALSCFASQWPNTIVLDCGTAITGVVVSQHVVTGYFIAPGFVLNQQGLTQHAQLLRNRATRLQPVTTQLVGTNTTTAMTVGCVVMPWLGISSWVRTVCGEATALYKVIVTGGQASLIQSHTTVRGWDYDPFAVPTGLHQWVFGRDAN